MRVPLCTALTHADPGPRFSRGPCVGMRRPRLVVVLVLALVLVYLVVLKRHYDSHDALPPRPPLPVPRAPPPTPDWSVRFAVMFDAGSTGTRVHIFKLRLDPDHSVPQLLEETFRAIKPGLSAFAEDPRQCKAGLVQLLDLAQTTVPVQFHGSTPVFLKATAGLRLLQGDQADRLLDEVRALFRSSPFVSTKEGVSILDGTDEGISAWLTVNFLLGAVGGAAASVGMLDLGGGSTQVTFRPSPQFQEAPSVPSDIHILHLFNCSYTLYTHSYLGLGLMSARAEVLGRPSPAPGGGVLVTPCLAPDVRATWEHEHNQYDLRGKRSEDYTGPGVFSACSERVRSVLKDRVRPVEQQQFYAFSFYYDRALDIRAIDEEGGVVSVVDYTAAAQRVCSGEVLSPDQSPLLCLDLVYISVLLQELGFKPDSQLKLVQKIGEVETSWALGATFSYMNL